MRFPRLAFRSPLLAFVLLSAAFVGCKQDIGERCEQGSDCSSGYCNYSTISVTLTNAQGRVCTGPLPPFMSEDAAAGENMTPSDAGDGATSSDAPPDSTPDTVAPPTDGPSDATESDQGG
jgi:hypothetical protein